MRYGIGSVTVAIGRVTAARDREAVAARDREAARIALAGAVARWRALARGGDGDGIALARVDMICAAARFRRVDAALALARRVTVTAALARVKAGREAARALARVTARMA